MAVIPAVWMKQQQAAAQELIVVEVFCHRQEMMVSPTKVVRITGWTSLALEKPSQRCKANLASLDEDASNGDGCRR